MTKTTFQVTTLNGQTATRKTERTYTHAIVTDDGRAMAWCGNFELATKQLKRYLGTWAAQHGRQFAIAEVRPA
jgi:phosphate starvation-inducible protein PhoH